jgi:HK97 family phage portal protein
MTATRKLKTKPKRKPKALSPDTSPPDPGLPRISPFIMPSRTSGVLVNEDTALTLSVVWACVRVISESLAGLPWHVFRKRADGGLALQADNDVDWLLDSQPNPEMPAFQFRETLLGHALCWGNGYAEIERDQAGRPVWLWPLAPDRVTPERATFDIIRNYGLQGEVRVGEIVYRVINNLREVTYLPQRDMYHLRGLGFDGLVGYSVIRYASRSIGIAIATEDDAGTLFSNGSRPQAVLIHPRALSQTAKDNMVASVNKQRRKGDTLVLEEDIKYVPISVPPRDAQLIEQRQFTPSEICRWFRVQPHKVMDLTKATFSNIEHQSIETVNDTYRPWAERLESEADIKLFGRTNRGQLVTVIDLNELKRGDLPAQTAFARDMFDRGIFSVNDGRQYFGMNPIGPDGDKRFVPLNFVTLENAGKPEAAEPEEAPEPREESQEMTGRLELAAMLVIQDACRRILTREDGTKHKHADKEWLAKHREYCLETLMPSARVLAELLSPEPESAVAVAVAVFLDKHLLTLGGTPAEKAAEIRHYIMAAVAAKGAA